MKSDSRCASAPAGFKCASLTSYNLVSVITTAHCHDAFRSFGRTPTFAFIEHWSPRLCNDGHCCMRAQLCVVCMRLVASWDLLSFLATMCSLAL